MRRRRRRLRRTPSRPATGEPLPFQSARASGLSVGVPGTVRGWETALKRYGTRSLRSLLRPGERIAREGFVVDPTFNDQVTGNAARFEDFSSTASST